MDKKIYKKIFCGQWYIPEFEKIIKSANRWANGHFYLKKSEKKLGEVGKWGLKDP